MENNEKRPIDRWAVPFAVWELRLYLDTHPNDEKALAAYRRLCAILESLHDSQNGCQCRSEESDTHWSWIDDPWPWQPEANDTEGMEG